jgi:16S rRNA processing protein RimM
VVGAHGLHGELRVRFFGDDGRNLLAAPDVWLVPAGAGRREEAGRRVSVRRAEAGRAGEVRLALEGVDDREAAQALRGHRVLVPPGALAPLPPGEFYWHELVGCRVEDQDGAGIGTVVEVWSPGAHDVLVVDAGGGRRHLLPAAREFLREVDVPGRRLRVEVIPGLLDADHARPGPSRRSRRRRPRGE